MHRRKQIRQYASETLRDDPEPAYHHGGMQGDEQYVRPTAREASRQSNYGRGYGHENHYEADREQPRHRHGDAREAGSRRMNYSEPASQETTRGRAYGEDRDYSAFDRQDAHAQGTGWNDDAPHGRDERGASFTNRRRVRSHMDAYYEGDGHYGYEVPSATDARGERLGKRTRARNSKA